MKRFSLLTAVLLLSSAWVLAQSSTSPSTQQYPSSSSPTAQDAQQAGTQTAKDASDTTVEGCLNGSAGSFTLTDSSGKTFQLAGDTSKLADHVGHTVKITGSVADAAGAGAASSGAGASPTLTVKKAKMVSSSCANK